MRKLILLLPLAIIGLFFFTGCSSEPAASTNNTAAPTKEATVNYDGQDKSDIFESEVIADVIDIYIVNEGTKSLYWQGTFKPASGDETFESVADRAALDASLMGSLDDKKVFKLDDGKITFDFSMMGTTKTVKMERN